MEVDSHGFDAAPGGVSAAAATAAPTSRDFLPFVEKYRPTNLDDLVSQNHIVTTSRSRVLVAGMVLAPPHYPGDSLQSTV